MSLWPNTPHIPDRADGANGILPAPFAVGAAGLHAATETVAGSPSDELGAPLCHSNHAGGGWERMPTGAQGDGWGKNLKIEPLDTTPWGSKNWGSFEIFPVICKENV